jgi:hypothetical protein
LGDARLYKSERPTPRESGASQGCFALPFPLRSGMAHKETGVAIRLFPASVPDKQWTATALAPRQLASRANSASLSPIRASWGSNSLNPTAGDRQSESRISGRPTSKGGRPGASLAFPFAPCSWVCTTSPGKLGRGFVRLGYSREPGKETGAVLKLTTEGRQFGEVPKSEAPEPTGRLRALAGCCISFPSAATPKGTGEIYPRRARQGNGKRFEADHR